MAERGACLGAGHASRARLDGARRSRRVRGPLRDLLGTHRLAYLYGCVAADIFHAKKYTRSLYTHCHCWPVGWQIVDAAKGEREEAFAYGYLSHLAADVYSHNQFVPVQLVTSFEARTLRHIYWEARFDAAQDRDRWRLVKNVLGHRYRDLDRLVERVVERTLFSFKTNKRIFDSVMALQQLEQWQVMVRGLGDRSRYPLPQGEVDRFKRPLRRRHPGHAPPRPRERVPARRPDRARRARAGERPPSEAPRAQAEGRGARRDRCRDPRARELRRVGAGTPFRRAATQSRMRAATSSFGSTGSARSSPFVSISRTTFVSLPNPGTVRGHVVGDDEIEPLRTEFAARLAHHVVRLGRKPDHRPAVPPLRQSGDNVGVSRERELQRRGVLLELSTERRRGPIVGDGRRHDQHRRVRELGLQHPLHVGGALDVDHLHAGWRRQRDRAAHQRHLGPAPSRDARDRVAHLPARVVAEVANGIDRLARGTGRHEHPLPDQILRRHRSGRGLDDLGGFRKTAGALVPARKRAARRADDPRPARGDRLDVRLRGRMLPHVHVHRGRDDDRRARREQDGGEEVVGDPVCHLRDQVCGRGGEHDDVGRIGEADVTDLRLLRQVEGVGRDGRSGERLQRERRDELARARVITTWTVAPAWRSWRTTSHAL
jgi:hypothetical protein